LSGIVAGGGWYFRQGVSAEARAEAERQVAPLPTGAGPLQRLNRRARVRRLARELTPKSTRPSRHTLY